MYLFECAIIAEFRPHGVFIRPCSCVYVIMQTMQRKRIYV